MQPPHLPLSDNPPPDVHAALADWAFAGARPGVREERSLISVGSSCPLWLDGRLPARDRAFMPPRGSPESTHVHADGSPRPVPRAVNEVDVLRTGWDELHPWRLRGVNEILVSAPRDAAELVLVQPIVEANQRFAVGSRQFVGQDSG